MTLHSLNETPPDPLVAGGKGANLGTLTRAGFAVPAGFCLTTDAMRGFVQENGIEDAIRKALDAVDSDAIRRLFLAGMLPEDLRDELTRGYQELGSGPVAVRSSAPREDGAQASFAGQHETFLNVQGIDELEGAVRRCWASLYSPQAMSYSTDAGAAMAVVIQTMVDAEAAGVVLTANPLSGDRDEVQVSAVRGSGEALVSGQATPDVCVLRGPELRPDALPATPALPPAVLDELGRTARRIESLFGSPQDIEWAWDGRRLWVLQARPMVLPQDEVRWENPVPGARWYRTWRLGEWLADPVTPLFATSLLPVLNQGREDPSSRLGWGVPRAFSMRKPWYCIVNGYYFTRDDRDESTWTADERTKVLPGLIAVLRQWRPRHRRNYMRRLRRLAAFDPGAASSKGVLAYLSGIYRDAAEWWFLISNIGFGSEERGFRRTYEAYFGDVTKPDPVLLFSGFDNGALRAQRELQALAEETGPAEITLRLGRWRAKHGHQVFTLDFSQPTLGEQPEALLASLRSYLHDGVSPPGRELVRQRRRRLAARRRLRLLPPAQPEQRELFEALLECRSLCAELRESIIYDFQRLWPLMRRALLDLGRRLAAEGCIEQAGDVFFLTHDELVQALETAGSHAGDVASRKAEHARQARLSPPEHIGDLGPEAGQSVRATTHTGSIVTNEAGRRVLLGQPASPGRVRGPARVIRSVEEFSRLRKGEILVCPIASPAWTVLFPLAAGLVTEVGGGATHSSLVAREYGLPAVVATGIATQVIVDGQMITLDGSRGEVLL